MLPKSLELCPLPLAEVDELFSGASGDHTGTLWNSRPAQEKGVTVLTGEIPEAREVQTGGACHTQEGRDKGEIRAHSRHPLPCRAG